MLYTSGAEPDWPDALDPYTGAFTYFGDNRSPGRELHDTPRKGNLLLSRVFERAHAGRAGRGQVPPFLLFDKPGTGRDVRFRGLLAPARTGSAAKKTSSRSGAPQEGSGSRTTAPGSPSWTSRRVTRPGSPSYSPATRSARPARPPWRTWVDSGTYTPLLAPPTVIIRSREQQQPARRGQAPAGPGLPALQGPAARLRAVRRRPDAHAASPTSTGSTSPGPGATAAATPSATTSSAHAPTPSRSSSRWKPSATHPANGVGVRETSRLISRLRHRQFGVLVTTSHLDTQAYQEIREDGHPVVVLAGRDIADILK